MIRFSWGDGRNFACAGGLAVACWLLMAPVAEAVFWRADWPTGDPEWLTEYDGLMTNVAKVNNNETGTFGTGVLIGDGWLLTAEHVIDTSAGDEAVNPNQLTLRLPAYNGNSPLGASEVHRHSTGDVALVKLTSPPTDLVQMVLNDVSDEVGMTLEVGGFGHYGPAGDDQGVGTYHRARNRVDSIQNANIDIRYDFDAPGVGADDREGISDNGDSGGPVMLNTNGDQWALGALTRAGSSEDPVTYGKVSWASRIVMFKSWIDGIVSDVLWRTTVENAVAGDLNFDGIVSPEDVNLLIDTHGAVVPEVVDNFDFYDDATIDATPFVAGSDLHEMITGVLGTSYADANLDGWVDGDDLAVWNTNYGQSSDTWGTGDFNFDGMIDAADYLFWQQEYHPNPVSGGQPLTAVPEPSTLALLSTCLLFARRKREI